ncbi:MAG: hypothetical protein QG612_2605, partial [Pseudomonadota bacterium]|nr:hypothetical protein [Pseudomonadota bacterium]
MVAQTTWPTTFWRDGLIGAALLGAATLGQAAAFKATLLVPAGDERL